MDYLNWFVVTKCGVETRLGRYKQKRLVFKTKILDNDYFISPDLPVGPAAGSPALDAVVWV